MAENKRTEFERERDLKKTAKMYLQGKTQAEIAESIGVSRQQIGYDIDDLITRWRESQISDIEKKKIIEVEKLNKVENEAWRAWERSWGKIKKSVIKSGTTDLKGDYLEETETTSEMLGNSKFLAVILKCSEQRCKILGLDIQKKEGETDEGLLAELVELLKEPEPEEEDDSTSDS